MNQEKTSKLELTASIVSAYVAKNSVPMANLADLVANIYGTLQKLEMPAAAEDVAQTPAVPIKKSITPDYIISLEDGRKFKSLKRHLSTHYGMTPEQYRAKWRLPPDYPMVAPNYAATRSALARSMGLGRKADEQPAADAPKPRAKRRRAETAEE